jgi:amino acid transporter
MLVVPQATLAASDAPFVTIVDRLLGPGNGRWISLFVVISGLGCLNGWTLLASELTRTLASRGLLPAVLGDGNRFGAPWASLLMTGALATVVGLMNYSASLVGAFTKLSLIVSAANLPLYVCCSFAIFALLRSRSGGVVAGIVDRGARRHRIRGVRLLRRRLGGFHLGPRALAPGRPDLFLDALAASSSGKPRVRRKIIAT